MEPKTARRFTLSDVMILVAGAAVGTLLLRSYLPGHFRQLGALGSLLPDRWGLWRIPFWLGGPVSCVVVPLMVSLIVLRLRGPRPRRTRLAGQPGFVACVAAMVSLLPGLAWYAAIAHRPGFQQPGSFDQVWLIATHWTGAAVIGSWIALGLARRWRPEASWIDRSGRALGAYWILGQGSWLAAQWLQKLLILLDSGGA